MAAEKDELYINFSDPTQEFLQEPRAFCYDLASQLVNQAKKYTGDNWYTDENTIKGLLLLLYTWNFAARETKRLSFENVRNLLCQNQVKLRSLENVSIRTADDHSWALIEDVFDSFRSRLGQTGASKALSLLNPGLFVMWDTGIRKRLNRELIPGIENGQSGKYYVNFLKGIQNIIEKYRLEEKLPPNSQIAKKLDEYHYVKIVMNRGLKYRRKSVSDIISRDKMNLPDNLRGRSIFEKIIPTVCNLENMLKKLKESHGDVSKLKHWEKRSYEAYRIHEIKAEILDSDEEGWKEIIRKHILARHPSEFGASCIDIYLVAYVSDNHGSGKSRFFQFIIDSRISQKEKTAQAIWQVGKGDGVFLDLLKSDGSIKDYEFFNKWVIG